MSIMSTKAKFLLLGLGAFVLLPCSMQLVHAAVLNFITSESITLSSPTATVTIATSSVADALQVNATSVVVTMSAATGGTFTLLSPSYDLAVATSSTGGTVTLSCDAGVESALLSQATGSSTYTLTPTTTNCAHASPPIITGVAAVPNSGGAVITWNTNIPADSTVSYGTSTAYGATSTDVAQVAAHTITLSGLTETTLYHYKVISSEYGTSTASGDGTFTTTASLVVSVAAGYTGASPAIATSTATSTPVVTATASSTAAAGTSTASLEVEIASLTAELNALLAQAKGSAVTGTSPVVNAYHFTRNLKRGDTGADVKALQAFLIQEDAGQAAKILARHGSTDYFGTLTFNALKEFQKHADIVPDSGYFGPLTRAYIAKQ